MHGELAHDIDATALCPGREVLVLGVLLDGTDPRPDRCAGLAILIACHQYSCGSSFQLTMANASPL
jgi:hypothetical protein